MRATAWFAMYGPANLPPDALKRLESAVAKPCATPACAKKLVDLGYDPVGSTSAELAAPSADLARWEKPIKATGVQLD